MVVRADDEVEVEDAREVIDDDDDDEEEDARDDDDDEAEGRVVTAGAVYGAMIRVDVVVVGFAAGVVVVVELLGRTRTVATEDDVVERVVDVNDDDGDGGGGDRAGFAVEEVVAEQTARVHVIVDVDLVELLVRLELAVATTTTVWGAVVVDVVRVVDVNDDRVDVREDDGVEVEVGRVLLDDEDVTTERCAVTVVLVELVGQKVDVATVVTTRVVVAGAAAATDVVVLDDGTVVAVCLAVVEDSEALLLLLLSTAQWVRPTMQAARATTMERKCIGC